MLSIDIYSRSIPTSNVPQLHSGHQTIAIMKNIISKLTRAQISQNRHLGTFMNEIYKYLEACLTLIAIKAFIAKQ